MGLASAIPNWITAISSLLAAPTLFYLKKYTEAAQEQVRQATLQVEASNRPILIMESYDRNLTVRNIGTGPALDVIWSQGFEHEFTQQRPVLAVGESIVIEDAVAIIIRSRMGAPFSVEYSSVSQIRYESTFNPTAEDRMNAFRYRTDIRIIPPHAAN